MADGKVLESYANVVEAWHGSNLVFGLMWALFTFLAGLYLIFRKAIARLRSDRWYQN